MDESIKKQILEWDNKFPVDKWWRDKHNIAFNSKAHQEISFLDQLFEYYEDKMYEEHREGVKYEPNTGNWLVPQKRSDEEKQESLIDEARREMEDLPDEF